MGWKAVKKVQGRLIREMEKKLSKRRVVFTAQRTILDKTFRRKGLKIRPRSRTLTSVHEAVLEDVCGPSEIVAKRTRCRIDGSKLLKSSSTPRTRTRTTWRRSSRRSQWCT